MDFLKNWKKWKDHKANPLITPRKPEWIIADPSFLYKDQTPDGKWHLFAHGILFGLYHFVSIDGLRWKNTYHKIDSGMRPFIFKENERYYLFYEQMLNLFFSVIILRESKDLFNWGKPKTIIVPSIPWEGRFGRFNSNPCLVKFGDKYRLYYSANSIFLKDCLFNEPKYIGIAESNNIYGPYKKLKKPIILPSKKHKYRNFGAGAIKVFFLESEDLWVGFNNGIFIDRYGRTRSSILLMYSEDGINWKDAFEKPIIYPTEGWKRSFVYQLDVKKIENQYWLYYNARAGWAIGSEAIGLAILDLK
ncbi:MAG: glycosyl hydrolase family 43 [Candidatus Helarchaeota archaeon]